MGWVFDINLHRFQPVQQNLCKYKHKAWRVVNVYSETFELSQFVTVQLVSGQVPSKLLTKNLQQQHTLAP